VDPSRRQGTGLLTKTRLLLPAGGSCATGWAGRNVPTAPTPCHIPPCGRASAHLVPRPKTFTLCGVTGSNRRSPRGVACPPKNSEGQSSEAVAAVLNTRWYR